MKKPFETSQSQSLSPESRRPEIKDSGKKPLRRKKRRQRRKVSSLTSGGRKAARKETQRSPIALRSRAPVKEEFTIEKQEIVEQVASNSSQDYQPEEVKEVSGQSPPSEEWSGSHESENEASPNDQEKAKFYVKMGNFTPRRLADATLPTPIRQLIFDKNPAYRVKNRATSRYGNIQMWFAIGVLVFSSMVAIMRKVTQVPESNFWQKSLDCTEGDIYCSFNDVLCSDRDEYHHCVGDES